MSCKGMERGEQIVYSKKPPKIKVEKKGQYCVCDNCAGYGEQMCYRIHYSKTDYGTPKGVIAKNRYAKPREIWLCEDCLKELQEAIKELL